MFIPIKITATRRKENNNIKNQEKYAFKSLQGTSQLSNLSVSVPSLIKRRKNLAQRGVAKVAKAVSGMW